MLSETEFFEYFYKVDEELYRQRNFLLKKVKKNPLDFVSYDLLREIEARCEQTRKIYMDLKGFFDVNRKLLLDIKLDK